MFRIAFAFLLGVSSYFAAGDLLANEVIKGTIKDVRGTNGELVVTVGEGNDAKDKTFLIKDARFVGPDKSELKVGDLRVGDLVEVEMSADGKSVQEVRVVKSKEEQESGH